MGEAGVEGEVVMAQDLESCSYDLLFAAPLPESLHVGPDPGGCHVCV